MASANKIVLASNSPRRKEILRSLGIKFRVIAPKIKEFSRFKSPSKIVVDLARKKALYAASAVSDKKAIVISADTVVVYKKEIIGKPRSVKNAEEILAKLSGTRHKVYTGVVLLRISDKKIIKDYDVSTVVMRELSPEKIKAAAAKHLDKAGAYAIQEKSDAFVEKIEGEYFNVVGLPVNLLKKMLLRFGVQIPRRFAEYCKKKL